MRRLWVLSDFHLEVDGMERSLPVRAPECDGVIVSGDISEGDVRTFVETIARLADGRPAIAVLGNHDLFGLPILRAVEVTRRLGAPLGVHVLEQSAIEVGGLRFAGGTLFDPVAAPAHALFSDPILVEDAGTADGSVTRHVTCGEIAEARARTLAVIDVCRPDIVVTHYPPGRDDHAVAAGARLWVHGHEHRTTRRREGSLEIVCNALAGRDFVDDLVVEIA